MFYEYRAIVTTYPAIVRCFMSMFYEYNIIEMFYEYRAIVTMYPAIVRCLVI